MITYHVKGMKKFVKGKDMQGRGFNFLLARIFDGSQIRELMKESMFDEVLSEAELSGW